MAIPKKREMKKDKIKCMLIVYPSLVNVKLIANFAWIEKVNRFLPKWRVTDESQREEP